MCIHKLIIFAGCGHAFFAPTPLRTCRYAHFALLRSSPASPWPTYTPAAAEGYDVDNSPASPRPPRTTGGGSSSGSSAIPLSARRICTQRRPPTTAQYSDACAPSAHPYQTRRVADALCGPCDAVRAARLRQAYGAVREVCFPESKWRVAYAQPGRERETAGDWGRRLGPLRPPAEQQQQQQQGEEVAMAVRAGGRTGYAGWRASGGEPFVEAHPGSGGGDTKAVNDEALAALEGRGQSSRRSA